MKTQEKGGSISTLLLSVIDVGDTQPPLAFNPTILLTSQSPLGSTQTTGLLLCDSDLLFRRIKLSNQPTIGVFKAGPLIVVLEPTKLYISTSYGNIFNQINITLTNSNSLTVNGEQIIVSDSGNLIRIDINTLSIDQTIFAGNDFNFISHVNGRLFLAAKDSDVITYSDDWGENITTVSLTGSVSGAIRNVRPSKYNFTRSYAWNGSAHFSVNSNQASVSYTQYTNFPSTSSDFVDFLELSNGDLLAVVGSNGIYKNTNPTSASSTWTLVQSTTGLMVQICELSDRIIVNGDDGIYTNLDKTGSNWTFTQITEISATYGSLTCDDATYLTDENTGDLLYDEETLEFITE
jgi:hypothetical protein